MNMDAPEIVQVNFRMPKELKDKLERSANESGRSITSELVTRLEKTFEDEDSKYFMTYPPTINDLKSKIDDLNMSITLLMSYTKQQDNEP